VIADIGGGEESAMSSILTVADKVIVPFQPNEIDIWTLSFIEGMLEPALAFNPNMKVLAIINRASTHPRESDSSRANEAISISEHIRTSGIIIRERRSISRCVPSGKLISEWKPPDRKAEAELEAIYNTVFEEELKVK